MKRPIGILDSGIGGITVLNEILTVLPNENYIYYSDSIHNPYGEKRKEEVIEYVESIMNFFREKNCKAVVFACNTATALAINEIRQANPDLIVIGIEPAYKMVHDYAEDKRTLVMATPATIHSEKFLALYNRYNNGNTYLLECPGLANLIENGNELEIKSYLKENLPQKENFEVVVLGCTHYPLIQKEIKDILGNVVFFHGGKGVAERLKNLLQKNSILVTEDEGSILFYDSSNQKEKERKFNEMLKKVQ